MNTFNQQLDKLSDSVMAIKEIIAHSDNPTITEKVIDELKDLTQSAECQHRRCVTIKQKKEREELEELRKMKKKYEALKAIFND